MRCGDRCCPVCRGRDYWRLVKGYLDSVQAIKRPKLLTLTVRNVPELTQRYVRWVRRCYTRLMHRKFYRDHVRGGLQSIEVTNTGKGWHVHLHVLIDCDYIPQARLSKDWAEVTGGSPVVDIRAAGSVREALSYCLKYLSKPPKLRGKGEVLSSEELEARREAYRAATHGVRLVQPFGTLFGDLVLHLPEVRCPDCGASRWLCWDFELMAKWYEYLDDKRTGGG